VKSRALDEGNRGKPKEVENLLEQPNLGGPAQDLSNFQTTPIPILSVLTCSTS